MKDLIERGSSWKEFVHDIISASFEEYFEFLGNPLKESQKNEFVSLTERYYGQFNILDLKHFITKCKHNDYRFHSDKFISCPIVLEWFTKYLNEKRNAQYEIEEQEEERKHKEELEREDTDSQEVQIIQERAQRAIENLHLGESSRERIKEAVEAKEKNRIVMRVIDEHKDLIGNPNYDTLISELIQIELTKHGIQ